MTFNQILEKYQSSKLDPFGISKILYSVPKDARRYQIQLSELLNTKIRHKDAEDLDFYLALAYQDGIDESYKPMLKELVLSTWHHCHEDIVDYISTLKDDNFTDDLYTIAITPMPYRQYDDELEATLRKCVHALKAIDSDNAKKRLQQLIASGNENVHHALEQYG